MLCTHNVNGHPSGSFSAPFRGFGLRRNSSNGSNLNVRDVCDADATNIEFDLTSYTNSPFDVKIESPTGEVGFMSFTQIGVAQSFTPVLNGCGQGKWTIRVYKPLVTGHEEVASEILDIHGVGTIFYNIDDSLKPRHDSHNFLTVPGLCPKHTCRF